MDRSKRHDRAHCVRSSERELKCVTHRKCQWPDARVLRRDFKAAVAVQGALAVDRCVHGLWLALVALAATAADALSVACFADRICDRHGGGVTRTTHMSVMGRSSALTLIQAQDAPKRHDTTPELDDQHENRDELPVNGGHGEDSIGRQMSGLRVKAALGMLPCVTQGAGPSTPRSLLQSKKCRGADSNRRPPGYESSALNQLSYLGVRDKFTPMHVPGKLGRGLDGVETCKSVAGDRLWTHGQPFRNIRRYSTSANARLLFIKKA